MVFTDPYSLLAVDQYTCGLIKFGDAIQQEVIETGAVRIKIFYSQIANKIDSTLAVHVMTVNKV